MFSLLQLFSSKNIAVGAIILCLSRLVYGQYQKTRYEAIASDYELFKNNQANLVAKIQQLTALKAEYAQKQIEEATINHKLTVESIKNDYNRIQKSNISTIVGLRNQLRSKLASANTLPEVKADTELSTEEWRNYYATIIGQYQELKTSCSITTSDYNTLRKWADAGCEQVGCL